MAGAKVTVKGMTFADMLNVKSLINNNGGTVKGGIRKVKNCMFNLTAHFGCWLGAENFISAVYRFGYAKEAIMKEE